MTLVRDTDFFLEDMTHTPKSAFSSSTVSMLDVTVDALCDRYDAYVEVQMFPLLQLLEVILRRSRGNISQHILQRIFRTCTLVCACHVTDASWLKRPYTVPTMPSGDMILAFEVMKKLIHWVMTRAEDAPVANALPSNQFLFSGPQSGSSSPIGPHAEGQPPDIIQSVTTSFRSARLEVNEDSRGGQDREAEGDDVVTVRDIVVALADDVIDSVETARMAERVQILVSKSSSSTSSTIFWLELFALSRVYYAHPEYQNVFVLMAAQCKVALLDIRINSTKEPMARDVGNKLYALEALRELCSSGSHNVRSSKSTGYLIRRLVVPSIISNIEHAFSEVKIFAVIMGALTALWKNWREHIRMEFAILCEKFVVRMLHSSASRNMHAYQELVLDEVCTWFEQPQLLVEMFVNFDIDKNLVAHWNIFTNLTRAVCTLAARAASLERRFAEQSTSSSADPIHEVTMKALGVVTQISKALMDATGHAYLIFRDTKTREKSLRSGGGWETDALEEEEEEDPMATVDWTATAPDVKDKGDDALRRVFAHRRKMRSSVRNRRERTQESASVLQAAIRIYEEKRSLVKVVRFLVSKNFMADTPQEVASFLRLYGSSFDPSTIGDFLGEGGKTPEEEVYWSHVRYRYTRAVSFSDMNLEASLRKFLTQCGFRLPGEGQKVARFVEAFVKVFWQDNRGTPCAPFKHQDTVLLVAYAIIMLNSDLHKQSSNPKDRKKIAKMTKEQFINNLRGVDIDKDSPSDSKTDIDREYLSQIYDNIAARPIEMAVDAAERKLAGGGTANVGNTHPTYEQEDFNNSSGHMKNFDRISFITSILSNLRGTEDLMRALSPFTHRFMVTGIDINISLDMVSFMFENVWHHFFALTGSLLSVVPSEPSVIYLALDVLRHALAACIFLDLRVERLAFANQLERFRYNFEAHTFSQPRSRKNNLSGKHDVHRPTSLGHMNDLASNGHKEWYQSVETATPENAMDVITDVHAMIDELKSNVAAVFAMETLRAVSSRIERKANIEEHNTFFVREGDLTKVSRKGKSCNYRFFLFSDTLMYGHHGLKEFKIHAQLSLVHMNVQEPSEDGYGGKGFYVLHPVKSFFAFAESIDTKQRWFRDLQNTIYLCKSRALSNESLTAGLKSGTTGIGESEEYDNDNVAGTCGESVSSTSPLTTTPSALVVDPISNIYRIDTQLSNMNDDENAMALALSPLSTMSAGSVGGAGGTVMVKRFDFPDNINAKRALSDSEVESPVLSESVDSDTDAERKSSRQGGDMEGFLDRNIRVTFSSDIRPELGGSQTDSPMLVRASHDASDFGVRSEFGQSATTRRLDFDENPRVEAEDDCGKSSVSSDGSETLEITETETIPNQYGGPSSNRLGKNPFFSFIICIWHYFLIDVFLS